MTGTYVVTQTTRVLVGADSPEEAMRIGLGVMSPCDMPGAIEVVELKVEVR